ncbi:acyl-CoA thioester hydrolase [Paracoccus versutus]|uniref:Acyl-CoA thioester hydrolase n=2 Tax=Paracoccus versutus TaxID=34007 RepID=A0AAQ0HE32_PARVE|nr:thioesterase family protein [Paracoccus versutus]REG34070.1 acyl-CoA thioester hydrolase [Paracoccus versutus]
MRFPVPLNAVVAHRWHCDHFGHLNARHYAAAFDDAIFIFWSQAGVEVPPPGQPGVIPVTAQLKIEYRSEVTAGEVLAISGQPARIGGKSVTLALTMQEAATGRTVATCEVVEVFFDALARQSVPVPDPVRVALQGAG